MEAKDNPKKEVIKGKRERSKTKSNSFFITIRRLVIVFILLATAIFSLETAKYYVKDDITSTTNLIINNSNVTARLKQELILKDNQIYISVRDIKNFFDNYIYEEEQIDKIITTYGKKIAEIGFEDQIIKINGSSRKINRAAIKKDDQIYLPITEMTDVYDIELKYIEETNIVTMDSLDREQIKAAVSKNVNVKDYSKTLSRTVDKVKKGEMVIVISETDDGWTKVRTENGKIGFVKTKLLVNQITVREELEQKAQIDGKINMFWDYFSEYAKAPNRSGENIEGVNVVSPAFFYIDSDGSFKENVGTAGKAYIEWAHDNGYKVWPMVQNAEAGIKVTSAILNDYAKRQKLIEEIVDVCVEYKLDGINIDFENMYEKDKNAFSRFVIELVPRMKEIGIVTSVDLTAPDGAPNWSLCYDRFLLGNVADYLAFMAYDQYGTSSDKAGTTAGFNWIETNLVKFLETYEVDSEKIILGIPFYTRIWTETSDGTVSSKVVNMKDVEKSIPDGVQKQWNDTLKQYYVEFRSGSTTKKMWVEDLESIKAKISLVSKYNLAGVTAWEKDRELDGTWELINKELGN